MCAKVKSALHAACSNMLAITSLCLSMQVTQTIIMLCLTLMRMQGVECCTLNSDSDSNNLMQIFQPLMSPLLSPSTVPKHPIRHLHERAQQDGKLLKFVCSVSNPRTEGLSPMEEAERKRRNGEIPADITSEQAAADAQQVRRQN